MRPDGEGGRTEGWIRTRPHTDGDSKKKIRAGVDNLRHGPPFLILAMFSFFYHGPL